MCSAIGAQPPGQPQGTRAPYSSFGLGLTLVDPGGNVQAGLESGILSISGTGGDPFWQGIDIPEQPWSPAQDSRGTTFGLKAHRLRRQR